MNYVQEARKIITDYFTAMKPSEQLLKEAADELHQGHITEAYAKELADHAANEKRTLRNNEWSQLEALLRKFALAAGLAVCPCRRACRCTKRRRPPGRRLQAVGGQLPHERGRVCRPV